MSKNALEVIMCTAILHNIATKWNDEDDLAEDPDDDDADVQPNEEYNLRDAHGPEAARRQRDRREGEQIRDNLMRFMPPPPRLAKCETCSAVFFFF